MADKNFRVHNGLDVGVANITASTGDANVGNLRINSNTIKSSTGNTAITLSDKDVTVLGNLTVQGTRTSVGTSDLVVQDSIINLHTASNLEPLTTDDGRDIGLAFHYYKTSDKLAFLGWANDSGSIEYYSDGTEGIGGTFTGTYGTFRGATFDSQATTGTAPFAVKSTTQVANLNVAVAGNLINGNSNVIVLANSNVTVSVAGTANVLTVTSTGANISGTLNTGTGNANVGNLGTGTVIATTANLTTINSGLLQNGTSNVTVNSSGNVNISVGGNVLTITSTGANIAGTLNTGTGNANVGNLGVTTVLATNVNASSNVNAITAVNSPAHVNGNSSVNIAANSNVTITATSNATMVVTATGANITGYANVTGNIYAGNVLTDNYKFANGAAFSVDATQIVNGNSNVKVSANSNVTVSVAGNANIVTVTGTGANVSGTANVTGNLYVGNILTDGYYFANGSAFSVDTTQIVNGNSNVKVIANSNVTISVTGTANVMTVTATGANISGTLNTGTGNANVGNLGTGTVIATTANLTTINGALHQNGNSNVTITANGNVTVTATSNATLVVTSTGANIAGTLNTGTGNANVGNLGTATAIITTANVTTINSGLVQNGTSNVTVNSSGNVNISVGGNILTVTSSGANVAGTANITGNVLAGANIVYTGNLYQGAQLRYAHAYTASTAAPSGSTLGDYWYDTATDILYLRVSDGTTPLWFDVSSQANTFSDTTTTNATITTASITTANVSGNINAANLQNGNSNVRIVANSNVSVSVGGTANVEVWSTTGANITGTLGVSGNANVGNLGTAGIVSTANNAGVLVSITDSNSVSSSNKSLSILAGASNFFVVPNTGSGSFNSLVSANDILLGFNGQSGQGTGNLTIAPWATASGGLKFVVSANVTTIISSSNVNPSANATYTLGNTTNRWSNIWGLASSAQYADLAERYASDSDYDPGTVVIFGGNAEITVTTVDHDPRIAGVISTEPGYLMNDRSDQDELMLPVALTGRVPTRVRGPIRKGDMVVSSAEPGVGIKMKKSLYEPGCVIGKSLENIDDDSIHTIEVVVGRL